MEKSPQELLLDEGVMLEIPEGANEQAIEQTIENALELHPDKLAADMNKVWLQETGEGISEKIQGEIKYKTERVQYYAKRYVSQHSQANLIKYREKVGSLYRELERAKQHSTKEKERWEQSAIRAGDAAERTVNSILTEGKTIRGVQENDFDRAVRKMGGWQNNQGFQGVIKVLKEYSRTKHISERAQSMYFDFDFLDKFMDKYRLKAHIGRGETVMWNLRRAFHPKVRQEEWYQYQNKRTRSLKGKRERVDTREVMKGIDPQRLAQRQQEKARQKQLDRAALILEQQQNTLQNIKKQQQQQHNNTIGYNLPQKAMPLSAAGWKMTSH